MLIRNMSFFFFKQITKVSLVSYTPRFLFTQRVLKSDILKWCVLFSFPLFFEEQVSRGSVSCVPWQHCHALHGLAGTVGCVPVCGLLSLCSYSGSCSSAPAPPAPEGTLHSDTPAQAAALLFHHVAVCLLTNL